MNMTAGRNQTTKGIWMSRATEPSILVMDVEGTDGRERGEDQDFERKSALFTLATAEVVLINMWENSVGLYNGANMSLLRTVMEVNLQLFQQASTTKTCLLFVLRDSTGVTPLESLAATLKADLEKIWDTLSKPPGKESSLISDYFEFAYANVAHKLYASKQFEEDVQSLQKRFYDKTNAGFIFKTKYHKGIPADGFPHFAMTIWGKVLENRDLDLPTQQQLLAQYRCDEIAKAIFDDMVSRVKQIKPRLDNGEIVVEFGKIISKIYETVLNSFDKDASRYHSETYLKKKHEFEEKIQSHLVSYYIQQLRNLKSSYYSAFQTKFQDKLKSGDVDFNSKFNECKTLVVNEFIKQAEGVLC
jgi:protein SEY1